MTYKNVLFDTSSGSLNMGDYIIVDSVEKELHDILYQDFLAKYSTHTPVIHFYQNVKRSGAIKYFNNAKYKFIAGTNILNYNMFLPWNNWNINIFNKKPYKNSILVGVGMNPNAKRVNLYTKLLYKFTLSKKFIHSVRDERTQIFLKSIGFKAINTGCATMWCLTNEHCKQIPTTKADNVVFTLTDYYKDIEKDQKLIEILKNNYKKIYFWVQGSNDLDYFRTLKGTKDIIIVSSDLYEYRKLLKNNKIDFVGTRLHAGIFALQNKKRTIILSVDNRTRDIKKNYNLPCIERDNIDKLDEMINSTFSTNININEENINKWKSQFEKR